MLEGDLLEDRVDGLWVEALADVFALFVTNGDVIIIHDYDLSWKIF